MALCTDKTIPSTPLINKFRAEKWSMWSLTNGLQQLSDGLARHLGDQTCTAVDLRTQTPCIGLEFTDTKTKVMNE
jgi:hypothetical protein